MSYSCYCLRSKGIDVADPTAESAAVAGVCWKVEMKAYLHRQHNPKPATVSKATAMITISTQHQPADIQPTWTIRMSNVFGKFSQTPFPNPPSISPSPLSLLKNLNFYNIIYSGAVTALLCGSDCVILWLSTVHVLLNIALSCQCLVWGGRGYPPKQCVPPIH